MTVLNLADALRAGATAVDKVYAGTELVWPVGGSTPSAYAAEVLADSPLAYYRLGEASGASTMVDSSGNGRHGVYESSPLLGATGLLAGDSDTGAEFIGSGTSRGRVPSAAWMNSGTLTVEAWVNLDQTNDEMLLERDAQTGAGRAWQFRVYAGRFEFITSAGSLTATSPTVLSTGTTYHLAATVDGSRVKTYINGVVSVDAIWAALLPDVTQDIWIGVSSFIGIWPVDGRIDEVAIYPTALSAGRIAAHYAAGI